MDFLITGAKIAIDVQASKFREMLSRENLLMIPRFFVVLMFVGLCPYPSLLLQSYNYYKNDN